MHINAPYPHPRRMLDQPQEMIDVTVHVAIRKQAEQMQRMPTTHTMTQQTNERLAFEKFARGHAVRNARRPLRQNPAGTKR